MDREGEAKMTNALNMALEYQQAGLSVFPLPWQAKSASQRWKCWQHRAASPKELAQLVGGSPSNLAVVPGSVSGNLAIIDCDTRDFFDETIEELRKRKISTWTVKTSRGGHIYVRTPVALQTRRAHGIDLKAEGSYALAPPSRHPDGNVYEFLSRPAEIALVDLRQLNFLNLTLEPALQPS